jgi:hypothetical protein
VVEGLEHRQEQHRQLLALDLHLLLYVHIHTHHQAGPSAAAATRHTSEAQMPKHMRRTRITQEYTLPYVGLPSCLCQVATEVHRQAGRRADLKEGRQQLEVGEGAEEGVRVLALGLLAVEPQLPRTPHTRACASAYDPLAQPRESRANFDAHAHTHIDNTPGT